MSAKNAPPMPVPPTTHFHVFFFLAYFFTRATRPFMPFSDGFFVFFLNRLPSSAFLKSRPGILLFSLARCFRFFACLTCQGSFFSRPSLLLRSLVGTFLSYSANLAVLCCASIRCRWPSTPPVVGLMPGGACAPPELPAGLPAPGRPLGSEAGGAAGFPLLMPGPPL